MQRKHLYYSGMVQGVGFRYTTRRIAANHDVTGYVRNLMDGRVELVAEGNNAEIDRFLAEISQVLGFHIRQKQVINEQFANEFDDFRIVF